ncbi:hypothetical protein OR1_01445 [Geobacter sp. OR-1]|uniref:Spy/CpxP family protein refolding chaperone n=1 Tax=Geobacter sp. OR-1 TaxID=1266765 RepID=UPI0005427CB6|nr:Spy/CpxP family protein refolding chaperone [Geobacter sp. OR-1]GAM09171.1 hypothetical protein OR1_01445 [Geobacter sp. OR-1]
MKKVLLFLLLTLVFVAPANSQIKHRQQAMDCTNCQLPQRDMEHMDMMGDMMGMCLDNADKIGLSEEQKKKVTPLHREMQKKQVRFKADLKIAQMEMKEVMAVKDFDLEKASAAVKKVEEIKTAHHLEMLKAMKEVRAVFTEDQFRKLQSMMPMKMGDGKPERKMKHKH